MCGDQSKIPGARRALLALSLVSTLSIGSLDVSASGMPVVETGPSMIQHLLNQLNTYTAKAQDSSKYAKDLAHYQQQLQHMKQQLVQVQGFMSSQGVMTDMFKERDESIGVEDECPDASGGTGLSLLKLPISLNRNGDIAAQQSEICKRVVVARNAKFNETVKLLRQLRQRSDEMGQLDQSRASVGTSEGALKANDNDVSRLQARTQMDLDYWQATMTAYDSYIAQLLHDQQTLARAALKGSDLGSAVQGIALKAALESKK